MSASKNSHNQNIYSDPTPSEFGDDTMSEGAPSQSDQNLPGGQQQYPSQTIFQGEMGKQQPVTRTSPQHQPTQQLPALTTPDHLQQLPQQQPIQYQAQNLGQMQPPLQAQASPTYQTADQQPPHRGLFHENQDRERRRAQQASPYDMTIRSSPARQVARQVPQASHVNSSSVGQGMPSMRDPQNARRNSQTSAGQPRSPWAPVARAPAVNIGKLGAAGTFPGQNVHQRGQQMSGPNNASHVPAVPGLPGQVPPGQGPTQQSPSQDDEEDSNEDDEAPAPGLPRVPLSGPGWKLAYTSPRCRPQGREGVDYWIIDRRLDAPEMGPEDRRRVVQPHGWQNPGYAENIGTGMRSGMNWLGNFDLTRPNLPVTKCPIQVRRGRGSPGRGGSAPFAGYPDHTAIIPAGLSLREICHRFPNHVWGDMLRIFKSESWGGHEIFNAYPEDVKAKCAPKAVATSDRKHNFLQAAMGRELDIMAAEDKIFRRVKVNPKKGRDTGRKDEEDSDDEKKSIKRPRLSSNIQSSQQDTSMWTSGQPINTPSVPQSVRDAAAVAAASAAATQPGRFGGPQRPSPFQDPESGYWWFPTSPSRVGQLPRFSWPQTPPGQAAGRFINQTGFQQAQQAQQAQSASSIPFGLGNTHGMSRLVQTDSVQTGSVQTGASNGPVFESSTNAFNNTPLNGVDPRSRMSPTRPSVNWAGCDTTASGGNGNDGTTANATNSAMQASSASTIPVARSFDDIPVSTGPMSPESVTPASSSEQEKNVEHAHAVD